jgi:hypothetical protein
VTKWWFNSRSNPRFRRAAPSGTDSQNFERRAVHSAFSCLCQTCPFFVYFVSFVVQTGRRGEHQPRKTRNTRKESQRQLDFTGQRHAGSAAPASSDALAVTLSFKSVSSVVQKHVRMLMTDSTDHTDESQRCQNGGSIPEAIHAFDALHHPGRTHGTSNPALCTQHFRASARLVLFSCISCLSWFKPDTVVINNHERHETHERNRKGSWTSRDSAMLGQLLQLQATLWL